MTQSPLEKGLFVDKISLVTFLWRIADFVYGCPFVATNLYENCSGMVHPRSDVYLALFSHCCFVPLINLVLFLFHFTIFMNAFKCILKIMFPTNHMFNF